MNARDGGPTVAETGGCSEGFDAFTNVLAPIVTEHTVGASRWLLYPAPDALARATNAIVEDPAITHCHRSCLRCDDAIAGGPILLRVRNSS